MEEPKTVQRFGKYELLDLLEEGIGGRLYRARDTQTDKVVLLKIVQPSFAENPAFERYFYHKWVDREVMLEHPNICNVCEVGKHGGTYYVTLAEVGGKRLSDAMKERRFDVDEVLEIIHQIAEALRSAHRKDFIHGHLKPTDIFLSTDKMGRLLVKVAFFDLGVAASDSMVSVYGETIGAPKYMAPELIAGGVPTPRSDIFSLGVIAYELATGKEPFPSNHVIGYLFSNSSKELTAPHLASEEVPRELSLVICRMLEKHPPLRYKNAENVIYDLDRCKESIKTGHVSVVPMGTDSAFARDYELPVPTRREPGHRLSPFHWTALGLAATAVVALLMVVVYTLGFSAARRTSPVSGGGEAPAQPTRPAGVTQQTDMSPTVDQQTRARARELEAKAAFESASLEWERYRVSGAYEMAITVFKKVAADYGDTPYRDRSLEMMAQIYNEWALELLKENNYESAAEKFKEVLRIAPQESPFRALAKGKMPGVLARWADWCYERGLYDKALNIYEEISADYPGTVEANLLEQRKPAILFRQAFSLWKSKERPQEALAQMQSIIKDYPDTEWAEKAAHEVPNLYLDLARGKIEEAKHEEACAMLADIIKGFPATHAAARAAELEPEVLLTLYESAARMGNTDAAARLFAELAQKYPTNPHTLSAMRRWLALSPQPGEAMYDDATARSNLQRAKSHYEQFQFAHAIHALESIIRYTDPQSPVGMEALQKLPEWSYRWALYTYGKGESEEGMEQLRKVSVTYAFSEWGKKAALALSSIKNAPEGMVYVPEGRFVMGTDLDEIKALLRLHQPSEILEDEDSLLDVAYIHGFLCEVPAHIAQTRAFYIDATEVTNEQYAEFVRATGHRTPPHWKNGTYPDGAERKPVVNVSFSDAQAYARWVGKRLPTEAEWEKAARGVDGRIYPWGDTFDRTYCHHMRERNEGPAPVGAYGLGSSPYGCLDMIGNVLEWTDSWFAAYEGQPRDNPHYGTTHRVLKGGGWFVGLPPIPTRCAERFPLEPEERRTDIGFRCVKDVTEQ